METISITAARRIALAAQGFADQRPSGRIGPRHIRQVLDRIGALQLDSVNVLCRSHYLPIFSRLGPYARSTLDRMAWGRPRELFEYWGHQTSLLPLSMYPLLRWRMDAACRWAWEGWTSARVPGAPPADWRSTWDPTIHAPWAVIAGMTRLTVERPEIVDEVLALVTERGPLAADSVGTPRSTGEPHPDPTTGRMWNWQDGKIALEWLFCMGKVTTSDRRNFARLYDLSDRVIPAETRGLPTPSADDAGHELMRRAARAMGVATEKQLRDYFRLPAPQAKASIATLVDTGELIRSRIEGVRGVAYRWHEADEPSDIPARALLSPFDSLIWERDRVEQLFGFRYRISIYTKESDRQHGYYVLPFLLGDRLVARVDVKADQAGSALVVPVVNSEPGTAKAEVAAALAAELRLLADWLELERIVIRRRGNLAVPLAKAVS